MAQRTRTTTCQLARRIGVDQEVLELLIRAGVIPGKKERTHWYIPNESVPLSLDDVVALTTGDLQATLKEAARISGDLFKEYQAICLDAREALDEIAVGNVPVALGDDLRRQRSWLFSTRNSLAVADDHLMQLQVRSQYLHVALTLLARDPDDLAATGT